MKQKKEPAQLYCKIVFVAALFLTTEISFYSLGFQIYFCTKHELKLLVVLFYCASVEISCLLLSILLDNVVIASIPDLLQIGGHHTQEDFAVRGKEPKDEVQIYTRKDATLWELTVLYVSSTENSLKSLSLPCLTHTTGSQL